MTQQPIKRRNPFDIMAEEEKVEEVKTPVIEEEKPIEEPFYTYEQPVQRAKTAKKQPRVVQRQQYIQQDDANREKYTSTMDVTLRRQIKIACAERGIMFAKFVEDACREKLAKEGYR